MRFLTVINMSVPLSSRSHTATLDSGSRVRNITGSFLLLLLSLLVVVELLFPQLAGLFRQVFSSPVESITLLGGTLLAMLLLLLPASWLIRALNEQRLARTLSRMGVMAKGAVMDKWTEELNGRPVYCIRYKYAVQLHAVQVVDRKTFEQLLREEKVFVLHLEDVPHISRLDLD